MPKTLIDVFYPRTLGAISIRGSVPPLSWEHSLAPTRVTSGSDEDRHHFELDFPTGEVIDWKAMRDDKLWSCERNYTMLAGDKLRVAPYFTRASGALEGTGPRTLHSPELGLDVQFRLFLPPSYDEHTRKHYPVLYAHDGQALFSRAPDPGYSHSWRMDDALDQLYDYGVIEETIVVAVTTKEHRIRMLSPSVDASYGGGDGARYLKFLTDTLKPHVDAAWRTKPGRETTAMIGASMGGLFSFYAAWTRNDVFGRVACLSPSFWWDNRHMLHKVQSHCPTPRPWLYIDSGAALSQFEQDANLKDGFDHTQAMCKTLVAHCYDAGTNLVTLTFAGFQHDASAWAARLALPLQLLFPRRG